MWDGEGWAERIWFTSFSSCLMKSLILDLKLPTYTSLSTLLFIIFASFLVEVLLLRGTNLKLGSFSLREIFFMVTGHSVHFPFDINDVFGMYCQDKEMI